LRGRGCRRGCRAARRKGDQRVELKIVTPPDIDKTACASFLTEWRKTHAFDPRADLMKEASR
jgi:hypothetical protein